MKTTDVVKFYGSRGKLAAAIECAPSSIYDWCEVVPFDRQHQIQHLTKGKLKAMSWPEFVKLKSKRGKKTA